MFYYFSNYTISKEMEESLEDVEKEHFPEEEKHSQCKTREKPINLNFY